MSCPTTLSSCVSWNGARIPALNICPGDTLNDIVLKLAACKGFSLSELDLSQFDPAPATLQELLQLLAQQSKPVRESYATGDPSPTYQLPKELQTEDPFTGEITSQLTPRAFAQYLAQAHVSLLRQHQSLQTEVAGLRQQLSSLERLIRSSSH